VKEAAKVEGFGLADIGQQAMQPPDPFQSGRQPPPAKDRRRRRSSVRPALAISLACSRSNPAIKVRLLAIL